MFVFEDLLRLDAQDMQKLLRHIDKTDLAIALKGSEASVSAHFFANMSERASSILRDDIEIMGPVRIKEVDQAQRKIVDTAKRLADDGEIILSKTDSEELVY
jgi:flagellar motor switch protein FliG